MSPRAAVAPMLDADDPVLAAIARARVLPPMPEAEATRLMALVAEAEGHPGPWMTGEQMAARLEEVRLAELAEGGHEDAAE